MSAFVKITPWLSALLSGILLALCFAPWNHSELVWIALLPLLWSLWALPPNTRRRVHFSLGYTTGITFFTITFHWLGALAKLFSSPGLLGLPLLLAVYLGLYTALWTVLIATPPNKTRTPVGSSFKNVGFALSGASVWVILDWLRGWLFTGFGWNSPGVALHHSLGLIQIADIVGVHGITFIVIFANITFALVLRRLAQERSIRAIPSIRVELMAVLLLVGATLSYSARIILNPTRSGITLHTASLQPNQPQDILFEPAVEDKVFATLDRLMGLATALTPQPDLILWPEAATPRGIFADEANHDFIVKQANRTSAPLLIGSVEPKSIPNQEDLLLYNSAILLSKNATNLQSYKKRHLVPFGEFLPFRDWLPESIRELVPGDLEPGREPTILTLEKPVVKIGALICFEDSLARETRSMAQAGAQVLINLTNDAWFATSAGAAQHLANSKFRAIETRLPLLRCANTGVTCLVDRIGRSQQQLPTFTEGIDTNSFLIPQNPPPTFYTRFGDNWIWICVLTTLPLIVLQRRKTPTAPSPAPSQTSLDGPSEA